MKARNLILSVPLALLVGGNALAAGGCPSFNAIGNFVETNLDLVASSVTNGSTNTYSIATPNKSPVVGGVPGLIKYCVYPKDPPTLPNALAASYGNWGTTQSSQNQYFGYGRGTGNPSNIPFDGRTYTVGTATWTSAAPAPEKQSILLHINDPAECDALYDNDPGTCFVYPKASEECSSTDCLDQGDGSLSGMKYYDANVNGQWNTGEPGIPGWPITIEGSTAPSYSLITDINGEFEQTPIQTGATYSVFETQANTSTSWIQTGNTTNQTTNSGGNTSGLVNFIYTVSVLPSGTTENLNFGNVCVGAGGGLTLGFWSNKNGQALFGADDLPLMVSLNLRNFDGSNFNPGNYSLFRTWLLKATATNMAYMLSAQLAAMELNVLNGKVLSTALILAPGTNSANLAGFATVQQVMDEADASLKLYGLTVSGSDQRTYQEALKTSLDNANNNKTFLQPGPSSCPTPSFPPAG